MVPRGKNQAKIAIHCFLLSFMVKDYLRSKDLKNDRKNGIRACMVLGKSIKIDKMCNIMLCYGHLVQNNLWLYYIMANDCLHHLKLTKHYVKDGLKMVVAIVIMSVPDHFNTHFCKIGDRGDASAPSLIMFEGRNFLQTNYSSSEKQFIRESDSI